MRWDILIKAEDFYQQLRCHPMKDLWRLKDKFAVGMSQSLHVRAIQMPSQQFLLLGSTQVTPSTSPTIGKQL